MLYFKHMNGYYSFDMLLNFIFKNHVGGFQACCSTMEEITNVNMKRFLLAILGIQVAMFVYLEMCRTTNVIVIQAHLQQVQSIIFYANSLKQHKFKSRIFWARVKVQRYHELYLFTSFNVKEFKAKMRVSK